MLSPSQVEAGREGGMKMVRNKRSTSGSNQRRGEVEVTGAETPLVIEDPGEETNTSVVEVSINDHPPHTQQYLYIMLNKLEPKINK
jgi:hypothetical protein